MRAMAAACAAAMVLAAVPLGAVAQDHHHHHHPAEVAPVARPAATKLGKVAFTDQANRAVTLPDGRLWVVTFFYGDCKVVCPRLIHNLKALSDHLPADLRARVGFAAITFNPTEDSADDLVRLARDHDLGTSGLHLMRGGPAATQAAITAFGFDFKPDGQGGFNHVNLLALMDGEGRILKHFYGLEPDMEQVSGQIRLQVK